jgi:hypothetical protein
MGVPEPATRDRAIATFQNSNKDIDSTFGQRRNLLRVAVLVRTAKKFGGEVVFNEKARLPDWMLLRVPRTPDGRCELDSDNLRFISNRVAEARAGL